jgi:hypothetical protein
VFLEDKLIILKKVQGIIKKSFSFSEKRGILFLGG